MVGPILSQILRGHSAKKTGIILKSNQYKKLRKMFFRLLIVSVIFVSSLLSDDRVAAQENSLENTSWQLKTIFGFNNSEYTPENPSDYLLRFRLDNRLQIEADCNQAGATWTVEEETISLTALVTTRKLCIQPSLFNRYIMNLNRTETFELMDNRLILRTSTKTDWMEFEPYIFIPSF